MSEQEKQDVLTALDLLTGIVNRNFRGVTRTYINTLLTLIANVLISR